MDSAQTTVELLKNKHLKITFVESCTGGLIASTLIGVSGASLVIGESYITYSNEAKIKIAGVQRATIEKYGAISAETAGEMAKGGLNAAESDVCVSVTGNAGPGADEGKEVGLVYIGFAFKDKLIVRECHFSGSRNEIRQQVTDAVFKHINFLLTM